MTFEEGLLDRFIVEIKEKGAVEWRLAQATARLDEMKCLDDAYKTALGTIARHKVKEADAVPKLSELYHASETLLEEINKRKPSREALSTMLVNLRRALRDAAPYCDEIPF